jgi:nucleoside-diphosphate-sugar epimerase
MSILVVGAGGFIGRHIVDRLRSTSSGGSPGFVLWRRDEHGSLLERADTDAVLAGLRPSAVLNLAWASTGRHKYEHDPINYFWAEKSLEFALSVSRHCEHYITFGSAAELNAATDTPYAEAKRQLLGEIKELLPEDSWTWLRPQWVYSWDDRRPRLLAAARAANESGCEFSPKTGNAFHDFIEVRDVSTAAMLTLRHRLKGELDIATGVELSVDTFLSSLGIRCAFQRVGAFRDSQSAQTQPSIDLLSHGWNPAETRRQLSLNS